MSFSDLTVKYLPHNRASVISINTKFPCINNDHFTIV